jgi:hypothetical protein
MPPVRTGPRDPRYKKRLRAEAGRMYRAGKTIDEIAETLGVSRGRAYLLVLESGVELRPRGPS